MASGDILTRFVEKIVVDPETGCHNWIAGEAGEGYGKFWIDGVTWRAHRASWFLLVGDIPEGMQVLHTCDNRKCVNPDHLYLGDDLDNAQDMVSKNRQAIGESHGLSKLTRKEVAEIKKKYAIGAYLQTELAEEYNVKAPTIWKIINNKTWRE